MTHWRHLVVALVAAFALAACSSSSDDPAPADETPPAETMAPEPEPATPGDLETTQEAAMAAAEAAKAASDAADMAADDAEAATANSATLQTGAMAEMYAMGARESAEAAMAEYMKAKAASDAAAAATMASVAGAELAKAEAAKAAAEAAAETAGEKATMATEAAAMELMIDGTMKSVGETTIDAAAPRSVVTSGSGDDEEVVNTGLVDTPTTTGAATNGRAAQSLDLTSADGEYLSPMVNAAERDDLKIGKVVDSADDMARLQIITAYASTSSVRVYAAAAATGHMGEKKGTVEVTAAGAAITAEGGLAANDNVELTLRPVGMFYGVDTTTNSGTAGQLTPGDASAVTPAGDTVQAGIKPKQVYSFVNTAADPDATVYVVLNETTATTDNAGDTDTVYEYVIVDVFHPVNEDGRNNDAPTNAGDVGTAAAANEELVFVTADLPASVPYKHLQFGVWAGLSDEEDGGDNDNVAGHGIGFVQSIGDGMTGDDMPSHGTFSYSGNWVATVQGVGSDEVALVDGAATLTANLDKSELTAALDGLATLTGAIDGDSFSGTKAAVGASNAHGLGSEGSFEGSFSGGFYGAEAAEAGGIFNFASDNSGAFRGAFGADRNDHPQ